MTKQIQKQKLLHLSDQEERFDDWYIDERMKEYINETKMLRWEGEQVPLHELKKRNDNDSS